MKHLKVGNVAFWRYDKYPYLLSGEISKITSSGKSVEIESFGFGYVFTPAFCLPRDEAEFCNKNLKELAIARCKELDLIKEKYVRLANIVLPKEIKI